MDIFAVEYTYVADPARLDEHRPVHRDFLRALVPNRLIAAGAYKEVAVPGALLLVRGETADEVARVLDEDPFHLEGLIAERSIRLWNPPIGQVG